MRLRILGLPLIFSFLLGSLIWIKPELSRAALFFGIWFTSMPHTFSTFTRRDLRNLKSIGLALAALGSLGLLFYGLQKTVDLSLVFMVYFFAQQLHYARQNFGIALMSHPRDPVSRIPEHVFYLGVPAVSLLAALSSGPQSFFGYAIVNPTPIHISEWTALTLNAFFTLFYYFKRGAGALPSALSHCALYSGALLSGAPFFVGWFVLNVFHNLQYLTLMVRREGSIRSLAAPFALTLLLYALSLHPSGPALFFALNFTHYLWDSWIWRARFLRKSLFVQSHPQA